MEKKLLLQEERNTQKVKEISMMKDAQKLKMIVGKLSWKILKMLSEEEMYPLEIARKLGIHEQKVYYHIRKLANAGAITVSEIQSVEPADGLTQVLIDAVSGFLQNIVQSGTILSTEAKNAK